MLNAKIRLIIALLTLLVPYGNFNPGQVPSIMMDTTIMATPVVQEARKVIMYPIIMGVTLLASGAAIVNDVLINNAYKVSPKGIVQLVKIPRLPQKYKKNGVMEKVHPKTGKIIQRRYYDENGDAYIDIDLYNHNNPEYHPWPQHKHVWHNGVRGYQEPLTEQEIDHYVKKANKSILKSSDITDQFTVNNNNEQVYSYSWEEFKEDLICQHEISLQHYDTEIDILFTLNKNNREVIVVSEINGNNIVSKEYFSKWQVLNHRFQNTMKLEEMWEHIKLNSVA